MEQRPETTAGWRTRRLRFAAAICLASLVAIGVWLASPRAGAWLQRRLRAAVAEATGLRVSVEDVALSLAPPAVRIGLVAIGDPAAPVARLIDTRAAFDVRHSLAEGRPALAVRVAALEADVRRWEGAGEAGREPARADRRRPWLPAIRAEIGAVSAIGAVGEDAYRVATDRASIRLRADAAGMAASVVAEPVVIERAERRLRLDALAIEGGLDAGGPRVESLQVRGGFGAIETSAGERGAVNVRGTLDLGELDRFWSGHARLTGAVEVASTVRGPISSADADGTVRGRDLTYGGHTAKGLSGAFSVRGGTLTIRDAVAEAHGGKVTGEGQISLRPPHAVKGVLVASDVDVGSAAAVLGGQDLGGALSVTVELSGTLGPAALDGRLTGRVEGLRRPAADAPGLGASLDGSVRHGEGATRIDATLAAEKGGRIALGASVSPDGALSGGVSVEWHDLAAVHPLVQAAGGGSLNVRGTLGGTLRLPSLHAELDGRDIVIAGARADRIAGRAEVDRDGLLVAGVTVNGWGGRAEVDGRIALSDDERNAWRLDLDAMDLAAMWQIAGALGVRLPYMAGKMTGRVRSDGPWRDLDWGAELEAQPWTIVTERLSSLRAGVSGRADRWRGRAEIARAAEESLVIEGSGTGTGSAELSVRSTKWALGRFRFLRRAGRVKGEAVLAADLRGSLARPEGSVDLAVDNAAVATRRIGSLELRAAGGADRWTATAKAAEARVSADGVVELREGFPFDLKLSADEVNLSGLVAAENGLVVALDGGLNLRGSLASLAESLGGELLLRRFEMTRGAYRMAAVKPIEVRGVRGRFEIAACHLEGELGSLVVAGRFSTRGDLALTVRGETDAEVLELLGEDIRWARGRVAADAYVGRSAEGQWDLRGRGQVADLAIDIGLPFPIAETNGGFWFEGPRMRLEDVGGRAGGGSFILSGYVDAEGGPRLRWQVADVSSGFLDWIEDRVSGAGAIGGTWRRPEVTGKISILSALYDRPVELVDLLPWLRQRVGLRTPDPDEKPIELDLWIRADDGIYLDNNVAKAEFGGDVHVFGTDLKPGIVGRLELLDGEVLFRERRFSLVGGAIEFKETAPIDAPELAFTAVTQVRTPEAEYAVTARLVGNARDYRVLLSADDPALTPNDIVSLITAGKTAAQIEREGGVGAFDVLALAPAVYGGPVQRTITRVLPLDRVEIEPAFSKTTGSIEPRLTVAKELTERLRAVVSSTFGVEGRSNVILEYRMSPRIILQGTWESQSRSREGAVGADIKFRHEFRRLPRFSLLEGTGLAGTGASGGEGQR